MSKTASCKSCGVEFDQYRSTTLYCKRPECKRQRDRQRWERWRERKEADGTFRGAINEYQRAWRERTGYTRDWELRKKYGITLNEWLAMVDAAEGKCEICGGNEEDLCVDHCHETGRVRGVLCRRCNRAMGQLGDTVEHMRRVVAYLERDLP